MKMHCILILFIAVVSLATVGCMENEASPQTAEHPPLRVGWANWPGFYPLIIGIEKGFFAEQGLAVEAVFVEGHVSNSILGNRVDAVFTTIGDAIELEDQEAGSIRLVLPLDYSDGGDAVLVTTGIETVADLEGQPVAMLKSPFSLIFVMAMFKEHALSLQSVNQISYRSSEALDLLELGQVKAAHLYEPYLSQGIEKGYPIIYSSRDTPGLILDVLIFRTEIVQERPDDVRAFIDGWFATVDWWQAHPEEGNAIMADYLKKPVEEVSTEGVAILNRESASRLFDDDADDVTSLYETAELYKDVMIKLGVLTSEPDLDTLIDSSFLE